MIKYVHIISDRAPWPVKDSIAIDIFYQLAALKEEGVQIDLHYFQDTPGCKKDALQAYCENINGYDTGNGEALHQLAERISKDNHPVLFEGAEQIELLNLFAAHDRKVVVRMHKDECGYCGHLAKSCGSFFKKLKLNRQVNEIKKSETALPANCIYAFSTANDRQSFSERHPSLQTKLIPAFYPHKTITSKTGIGNFCLYHGDLSDPCNEKAATWLLTRVFDDISTPIVVAGKRPGRQLSKVAELYSNCCLITDPGTSEMNDLISKAHIPRLMTPIIDTQC